MRPGLRRAVQENFAEHQSPLPIRVCHPRDCVAQRLPASERVARRNSRRGPPAITLTFTCVRYGRRSVRTASCRIPAALRNRSASRAATRHAQHASRAFSHRARRRDRSRRYPASRRGIFRTSTTTPRRARKARRTKRSESSSRTMRRTLSPTSRRIVRISAYPRAPRRTAASRKSWSLPRRAGGAARPRRVPSRHTRRP